MLKQLLTLAAATTMCLGVYAQDATLVDSYKAIWQFYNSENETWEQADESGTRTLEQYSDGTYKILNAFGSDAETDVLTFVLTEDNLTFQGLSSYGGAKYIYYNGSDYYYLYDSECYDGAYSLYEKENGYNIIEFWISGATTAGYYCLLWQEPDDPTPVCGTYNVVNYSGYSSFWYDTTTSNWVAFEYNDYEVEITKVGNKAALSGLTNGLTFYGEYNAEESTITFPAQLIYGEEYPNYYFCAEIWDGSSMVFDPEATVAATINEDGTINFDGWALGYVYDDGSMWGYLCYVETELAPKLENDPTPICGTYNVVNYSGYSSFWYDTTTSNWLAFAYNDYDVELSQVEGSEVALSGLTNDLTFYGVYNEEESTITFPAQLIYGEEYPNYYFCKEIWDGSSMVFDPDAAVTATVNEDGTINFDGWALAYVYDDGSMWGYLCYVETELAKKTSGIVEAVEANSDEAPVYFNLQGMRVDNPGTGLYIVKRGNSTSKVLIK